MTIVLNIYLYFRPNPPKMAATVPSKKIGGGSGAAGQREYTVRALTWHARHATSNLKKKKKKKPELIYLRLLKKLPIKYNEKMGKKGSKLLANLIAIV